MKRMTTILGITTLVIFIALSALNTHAPLLVSASGQQANAAAQVAQQGTLSPDLVRLATALLVPPSLCVSPCLWDFQPGVQTLTEFKALTLSAYGAAAQAYAGAEQILTVFFSSGIGLHTNVLDNAAAGTVVDYVYVRVALSEARLASVNFDGLSPATLIKVFGKPGDAYLLFDKKLLRFSLFLYYPAQSFVYVIRSAFDKGKACLTLANVETLTVYRFKDAAATQQFIKEATGSGDSLPPSISVNTRQSLNDFTQIAQSPSARCLIPK